MNIGFCHRIVDHLEEAGGSVPHEIGIDIERRFRAFIRRERESGRNAMQQQGRGHAGMETEAR